ncbi:TetR family transcriptional regulator [Deinococcus aerolatus]|uniref:TetR family transcriptional regulator n=2 Tax=Deinococcus aerolatus TaxID=522487 RepID=A0ABQ2GE24_9DEIO|nr:TetR family transcriptional regulator [Deinococcus aerolatus]
MRARSLAEKRQRRADILSAAENLWITTPYAELSMNQVAGAAQLAKGTLYLYFDTKEELFLALVDGHLEAWMDRATILLGERRPRTPSQLADVLLEAGDGSAALRRLLVLLGTVLARRVRPELLQEFYETLNARLDRLLALMPLERSLAERVVMHLYALSIGWQHLSESGTLGPGEGDAEGARLDARPVTLAAQQAGQAEEEFKLAVRAVIERVAGVVSAV